MTAPKLTSRQLLDGLARFVDQIVTLDELRARLQTGRKLVVKFGVDVTAPDLHVGHAVNLRVLRMFQDAGHKVVFLIGTFTTQIGDPTGKNASRPIIPLDEIKRNAQLFIAQAKMVLLDDPDLFEVRENSEWFDSMSALELLQLQSRVTVSSLLARDAFRELDESEQATVDAGDMATAETKVREDVHFHEVAYPLLQAWDSVKLHADVVLLGSDQLFNEMLGRTLQKQEGQRPQVLISTKIVNGLCGKRKQSKSLGNFVAMADTPRDKFGKVMTLPDELIIDWMLVHSDLPMDVIEAAKQSVGTEPMKWKKVLAHGIVAMFHGNDVADEAEAWFASTFQRRQLPTDIPEVEVSGSPVLLLPIVQGLRQLSGNQARRLFADGAISVNGTKVMDVNTPVALADGDVLKVGKSQFFKVRIR